MSTITFPGLATGIDTNTIISQLMAVEGQKEELYTARLTTWQNKKDAVGTLKTDLSNLQSAVSALSDADNLKAFNISSSDTDKVTAEATSSAYEGNHTIVVNQLATADRWVQTTGLTYAEDYVGAGTFIYSYDGKETVITTTSTTTLQDFVGLINNDANNPGVTASLLYYNNAYHLVLNGNNAGSDYGIFVNSSTTEAWQANTLLTVGSDNAETSTLITKLDQFGTNPLQSGEQIEITGKDHNGNDISPVTINLTNGTKISNILDAIEQAFDGNVNATLENGKIVVTDKFSGESGLSVTLADSMRTQLLPTMAESTHGGGIEATPLEGFDVSDFTRSQVAQDSKIKVDGFPSGAAVSEVQQITHAAVTGTFKLSYGGYTTLDIDYSASVSDIQAELDALPSVQPGDITVGGTSLDGSGTLTFTFASALGDVSNILIDPSNLSDTLAVTERTKGVAISEVQQVAHSSAVTSGTFKLSYGGYTTSDIDYGASVLDIQAALNALPSVQSGDITVSGDSLDASGTLTFTFADTLGDVSSILIDSSNLSDPTLAVTERTKSVDKWISRSSNTIDDVLSGITLHLHDVTESTGEKITLTRDVDSVKTKIATLVGAYNTVASYIKDNTAYDQNTKKAGTLMGDFVVTNINSQIYTPLISKAQGFINSIDSFLTPGQLGLEFDKDGTLTFDSNAFDTAVSNDYMDVLALIGANKTGSSSSNTIRFYEASSSYTTAGEYDVKVAVSGGAITSAQIKLSSEPESAWRNASYSGNTVTGDSTFDDNGNPVYPENGLLLGVDLSQNSGVLPFTATVRVKQGFAGVLGDALDAALKTTTGSMHIDETGIDDQITGLNDRISQEEDRLTQKKQQLVDKYARLEATLTLLKSQLSALTALTG